MVVAFESVDEILKCDPLNNRLLTILGKVVLTLESVDKTRRCDHSNESY